MLQQVVPQAASLYAADAVGELETGCWRNPTYVLHRLKVAVIGLLAVEGSSDLVVAVSMAT